jgi:CheY-like chemotaxis protein/HPt (histidine-containing phosphotransfer) domain-containing protein
MDNSGKTMPAVLVVDDDPVCRLFCVQALMAVGYLTFAASDGSSAIQIALRERPRLILTDMHLPDTTGAEAMARLLELWPDAKTECRFIGLSGDDSIPARTVMLAAGFALMLVKPFQIETLQACVRKVANQLPGVATAQAQCCRPPPSLAVPVPQPLSVIQLQRLFRAELDQQLHELDCTITSLDWKRAIEILHRLCGAAALAGYSAFARRGRLLLQQLQQPQDHSRLAETYLDFLGEAADLLQERPLDADR